MLEQRSKFLPPRAVGLSEVGPCLHSVSLEHGASKLSAGIQSCKAERFSVQSLWHKAEDFKSALQDQAFAERSEAGWAEWDSSAVSTRGSLWLLQVP